MLDYIVWESFKTVSYKGLEDSMPYIRDLNSYHIESNDHSNWRSRSGNALFALDVDHLQYLIDLWIECDNPEIRDWACYRLQSFPCPEAVEALCRVMLHDPSPDVRSAAAQSLIEISDPSALPALE